MYFSYTGTSILTLTLKDFRLTFVCIFKFTCIFQFKHRVVFFRKGLRICESVKLSKFSVGFTFLTGTGIYIYQINTYDTKYI